MSGLLISILISKCIYSNFDSMDAFRFHIDYVNSLILRLFITLLHNHKLKGIPKTDETSKIMHRS